MGCNTPRRVDALGKLVKARFIETLAWVETARLNVCQCYHRDVSLLLIDLLLSS